MESKYNMRSPAVKRLMREAKELNEPTVEFFTQPLEDNLFEWHFTVCGPPETEFDGGMYHGRIILPPEYPMKPPSIILLTPNGRFEINKKICLSISGHHPESWQPSWSIRTALLAIIGFMPTKGNGAIGSLDYTPDERKILARKSHHWKCDACGPIKNLILQSSDSCRTTNQEAIQLATQISFKGEVEHSGSGNTKTLTTTLESHDSSKSPFTCFMSNPVDNPLENLPSAGPSGLSHYTIGMGKLHDTPKATVSGDPNGELNNGDLKFQASLNTVKDVPVLEKPSPVTPSTENLQNLRQRTLHTLSSTAPQISSSDSHSNSRRNSSFLAMCVLSVAIVLLMIRRFFYMLFMSF